MNRVQPTLEALIANLQGGDSKAVEALVSFAQRGGEGLVLKVAERLSPLAAIDVCCQALQRLWALLILDAAGNIKQDVSFRQQNANFVNSNELLTILSSSSNETLTVVARYKEVEQPFCLTKFDLICYQAEVLLHVIEHSEHLYNIKGSDPLFGPWNFFLRSFLLLRQAMLRSGVKVDVDHQIELYESHIHSLVACNFRREQRDPRFVGCQKTLPVLVPRLGGAGYTSVTGTLTTCELNCRLANIALMTQKGAFPMFKFESLAPGFIPPTLSGRQLPYTITQWVGWLSYWRLDSKGVHEIIREQDYQARTLVHYLLGLEVSDLIPPPKLPIVRR